MKTKITSYILFFTGFCLFFFYSLTFLQAQTIPDLWSTSIKTSRPTAVAVDSYENLYIVEAGKNHLLVYNSSGKYLKKLDGLDKPISLAVDNNGRIFIGNAGRGNVEVFKADLTLLFKLGTGDGEFKQPTAIAVDSEGNIYVADGKENKIKVYHSNGANIFSFGASGNGDGQFNYPTSIAIDEQAGELIVCDLQVRAISSKLISAARIQVFTMDGDFKRSFGDFGVGEGLLIKPLGVDIDTEGRIYVADAYQNVVQVFDRNGNSLKMLYDSDNPLRTPLSIAIGEGTRRLFIASLNTASVEVYKVAGENDPPTADAGPDQTKDEGDEVTLDGSYSIDADGSIVSYSWEQTEGIPVDLSDTTAIKPTFTAPDVEPGGESLSFQLTVTDNGGLSSTDICMVNVTWINIPPTANAGPDQTKDEGDTVTLDGSDSIDTDGSIASYQWEQTAGTSVELSDTTAIQPTFTAPDIGPGGEALSFQLTVTDNGGLASTDICMVNVTWINIPPTAYAGPDQTKDEGDEVTLDGSDSIDADGSIASYLWEQTAGIPVELSGTTAPQPSFSAPDVGPGGEALSFQLTVTDNGGLASTDTCIVNVSGSPILENDPPTADAGSDQTKDEGDTVTLDGSDSIDADGSIASYQWEQTAGTPVELSDTTAIQPTFSAPDVGPGGEALSFQLTVTDNDGLASTDTCIINVTWINIPPTAYAGPDQTKDEGDTVTLDGSNSIDADDSIASYLWEQTAAAPVELSDTTAAQPTFSAPDVGLGGEALSFQLTVTDNGGLQSTDTCIVNVTWENEPPTADAGPDQTKDEGDTVTLDGSNSIDPDDSIASYLWEQTAGAPVELSGTTSAQPTFSAPDVGPGGEALSFQLTVTDNGGLQSTDTCIVNVTWINEPPKADASGPDQAVNEGVTVTLDDSGSTDPDDGIASCLWVQTDGTPVTLSDPTASRPTFVAPRVANGSGHTLTVTFQLTITDNGGLQDSDEVLVTINDNGITGFPDDVLTFKSSTGEHIGIKEDSGGNITSLNVVDTDTMEETGDSPQNLMYGLLDTQIKVDVAGDRAAVTVYLPNPAPEGYKWYKYNSANGWIDFSRDLISGGLGDGAEFNEDRTRVTLYITDNGNYDDDPRGGIIKDPSGIGIAAAGKGGDSSPNDSGGSSSGDSGGGGCFIAALSPANQTGTGKGTPLFTPSGILSAISDLLTGAFLF